MEPCFPQLANVKLIVEVQFRIGCKGFLVACAFKNAYGDGFFVAVAVARFLNTLELAWFTV